jgi:hypothetical protein
MLNAYIQTFDMARNLEKILELNMASLKWCSAAFCYYGAPPQHLLPSTNGRRHLYGFTTEGVFSWGNENFWCRHVGRMLEGFLDTNKKQIIEPVRKLRDESNDTN